MLMADTMAVFFVVAGLMISFVGLWLLFRGIFANAVLSSATRAGRGLVLPFFLGIPIALVTILAAAVLGNIPGRPGSILAGAVICAGFAFAHVGVAGIATQIGAALASPIDETQPWRATMRGGIVLVLSFLIPVFGWFVLLPISFVIGAGLAAMSLAKKAIAKVVTQTHADGDLVFGTPASSQSN